MSAGYSGIQWNRQKRWYDLASALIVVGCLAVFVAVSFTRHPAMTVETAIIRATSITAFLLLHVILCIGPLARLDRRFLPWLYNRRHLGVTMFVLAFVHAVFATIQFHALSGVNPLVSVFTAYRSSYNPLRGVADFPFEPFGALALGILFLMAATSHDFWLKNLGASFWKALHLLVLVAYGSLVVHVAYGALQSERHPLYLALLVLGAAVVIGLHAAAAARERAVDGRQSKEAIHGFVRACPVSALEEGRGRTTVVDGERIAVFLHEGRVFALSNVCRHQGGPIGEGRIVGDCVTCPWHGWQYRPEDGQSPPPFDETLETYPVRVIGGEVCVGRRPSPPGTRHAGAGVEE